MINIINQSYYSNKLYLIKVKQLLIKKNKNYFDFETVSNINLFIFLYLIIQYCQEKSVILISIQMIYKEQISSYFVITLKLFLLFHVYQHFFLALIYLAKVNLYHVFLAFTLTTIFVFDLKYHLDLVIYYSRSCILLFIYKQIHTIDDL